MMQKLRVGAVVDYADTTMTAWYPVIKCDGISLTVKE